jgi:hypothetical protein
MSGTHEVSCLVLGMYSGFGAWDLEIALPDPALFFSKGKKSPS